MEKCPTYQAQLFDSIFLESKSSNLKIPIPEECILGFKPDRIVLFDKKKNEVKSFMYETILNWGISRESFVLTVLDNKDDEAYARYHFKTGQTNVIQTLMEVYTHLLVGTSLPKITAIVEERDKQFENFTSAKRVPSKYDRNYQALKRN